MTMIGIQLNHYAAMDGGERRGRHVHGWTFDPQLRLPKEACGGCRGCSQSNTPCREAYKKIAPALQSAIQFASVRKGPFTSPPAPVGAPTRVWPLLTGLCDSHRSQDGASLGPPCASIGALAPIRRYLLCEMSTIR